MEFFTLPSKGAREAMITVKVPSGFTYAVTVTDTGDGLAFGTPRLVAEPAGFAMNTPGAHGFVGN